MINGRRAASSVLHRFQITNLDGFFRCHIVFLSKVFQFLLWLFLSAAMDCKRNRTDSHSAALFYFLTARAAGRACRGLARGTGRDACCAAQWRSATAAFSIFFGFEVTNFYVFLGCHNFSFPVSGFWFVLCKTRRTTNGARQRHSPWGSSRRVGSSFVCCASVGDFLDHRRAHCFCSTDSLWLPINTIRATARNAG